MLKSIFLNLGAIFSYLTASINCFALSIFEQTYESLLWQWNQPIRI